MTTPHRQVDELLAMAQLQTSGRQWASVYELAQQVGADRGRNPPSLLVSFVFVVASF